MNNLQYTEINQKLQQFMQQKKYKEALTLTKESLQINSSYLPWWKASGIIYAILKDYDNALNSFNQALQLNPNDPAIYNNLGNIKKEQNKFEEAQNYYLMAIKLEPNYYIAYNNLANTRKELGKLDKAREDFLKAIELNPKYYEAYNNLGVLYNEEDELRKAEKNYLKSISINPNYDDAYFNLGNLYKKEFRYKEAEKNYLKTIELNNNYTDAYCNLGAVVFDFGKIEEAEKYYDIALKQDPKHVDTNFNKAFVLLKKGSLKKGFELYEARWERENSTLKRRDFVEPLWLGKESIKNKTILIHVEQGLGDTIQFCRYIKLVAELGANVIFELNKALYSLLSQLEGVKTFIKKGDPLPKFDFHCPLMSLPLAFKTTLRNIPSSNSYLKAESTKVDFWAQRLKNRSKPKIGIVWNGSEKQKNDRNRSLSLKDFVKGLPQDYEYISLQKEIKSTDLKTLEDNNNIHFFGDELNDFSDTAALCSNMDLVISVCTSVAHLSGALGKKTWVLLSPSSDWRWLTKRDDSPWYPTAKLYRATDSIGCESSLVEVKKDLEKFIEEYHSKEIT